MKKLFVAPVLISIFTLGSFVQAQTDHPQVARANNRIKVKYDKKKDVTTVSLKSMALSGAMTREVTSLDQVPQLTLDAFFTYPGEQLTAPAATATLRFTSRARYPVLQKPQNVVAFLDDGSTIPLGGTTYKNDAQTFYTDEILEISVPFDNMRRLTSSERPRVVLGNREITFRSEQLRDMRDLMARMSP